MATMIPAYCDPATKSSAERRLFVRFRDDEGTKDWIVLHSIGLGKHVKQRYGEIDFFVITPTLGVYVIEVKGGQLEIRDGVTISTDRFGGTSRKNGTPFEQVRNNMFSIMEQVRCKFDGKPLGGRLFIGMGVMMPDIVFDDYDDPSIEGMEVFDRRDMANDLSRYFQRLCRATYREGVYRLEKNEIRQLRDAVRPNFIAPIVVRELVDTQERMLGEYTAEQFEALDLCEDNERVLFTGAAGTGKTVLALELARRTAAAERRVLLLCSSPLLGKSLASRIAAYEEHDRILVGDIDAFFRRVLEDAGETVPAGGRCDLAERAGIAFRDEPWDLLVIDEAQDLLQEPVLEALDCLLRGGLRKGAYAFFGDFTNQAILEGSISLPDVLDLLKDKWSLPVRKRLTLNCRNTRRIAGAVSVLARLESDQRLSEVEGEKVLFHWTRNRRDLADKLGGRIRGYLDKKVAAERIVVLGYDQGADSILSLLESDPVHEVCEILDSRHADTGSAGRVRISTVRDFKGLEASVVLLVGVSHFDSDLSRQLLYTGMSRPLVLLEVFAEKNLQEYYSEQIVSYLDGERRE